MRFYRDVRGVGVERQIRLCRTPTGEIARLVRGRLARQQTRGWPGPRELPPDPEKGLGEVGLNRLLVDEALRLSGEFSRRRSVARPPPCMGSAPRDPRHRSVVGHRRAAHVRRHRRRVLDLQHRARAAPHRHRQCAVRCPRRRRHAQASGLRDRRSRPGARCPVVRPTSRLESGTPGGPLGEVSNRHPMSSVVAT